MRTIESANFKKKKRKKTKHEQRFVQYWSLVEPRDYAKDMAKKSNGKL